MKQCVEYWDVSIYWTFNSKWHRNVDLPASYRFSYGKLVSISYLQHDKLHRTTGPAFIHYKLKKKVYCYRGRSYDNLEVMLMMEVCS